MRFIKNAVPAAEEAVREMNLYAAASLKKNIN